MADKKKGGTTNETKLVKAGGKMMPWWTVFEQLCGLLCSEREIAAFIDISPVTLRAWVKAHYEVSSYTKAAEMFRDKGRVALRQNLFNLSKKNPAAAIFLAKNHLGMSDNPQPVDTGEKRREFESAIKIGAKALAGMDLSGVMDVPPRKHITQEAEDDGDG